MGAPAIFARPLVVVALLATLVIGCDTGAPMDDQVLVIEGYVRTGQALPPILVQRGQPLSDPIDADAYAISDAEIALYLDGRRIPYAATDTPGHYAPVTDDDTPIEAYTRFRLEATWRDLAASAAGSTPPEIRLDSLSVHIPDSPVDAILLDSLRLDTLGVGAQKGFLYPVEVTLWWRPEGVAEDAYWIETQLRPRITFSSAVIDFFLQPNEIRLEDDMTRLANGAHRWTGVYGIPVDSLTTPFPPHALTVYLVRSMEDYARFAATRDAPQRREPASNLEGASGIFAGISIDSLTVNVAAAP